MNYATIKKTDVANGPGIRVSLFVSGCTHRCKGCFNSEAWDFGYGQRYTKETEREILEALAPEYIRGLSLLSLVKKVRQTYPGKDIWCYTGYDYEKDLLRWAERETPDESHEAQTARLLSLIDVLVDGEFVEEKKNLRLAFRGSENQRLIDVKESLRQGRTVCL